MIRQAISCDICGAEKKQTNHWFVAYEQGGELRVSGWKSRNRLRAGSKHLCGQACVHKLLDDFIDRALTAHQPQTAQNDLANDAQGETLKQGHGSDPRPASAEIESSARSIAAPAPVAPARPSLRMPMELVVMPGKARAGEAAAVSDEPPRFASRNWRAAAWERERERELRAGERHPDRAVRRSAS